MLIEHERLCMEDLRAAFGADDASRAIEPVTTRILASRKAILESIARPPSRGSEEELGKLLDAFEKAGIERSIARNAFHRGEGWVWVTDSNVLAPPKRRRTAQFVIEADEAARQTRSQIESYVSRLRDERLTPEEAKSLLRLIDYDDPDDVSLAGHKGISKLRLLSTSDSEQR